ncbi:MAG: murein biosynthesis integral membrane protein MurJ [Candidatus Binatia bacterium]
MRKLKSAKDVIVRGAALLAVLQVFEQLTGFLSQALIAGFFGASAVTDAYLMALVVLSLITMWVTLPIMQVVIPMFRYDLARQGEREAWQNVSVLLNNLLIVFVGIAIAGWLLAPFLTRLIGAGFDAETAELSASLTRIVILGVVFLGAASFLSQIWYSYDRFLAPGISGIVTNLTAVAGILLLAGRWGIYGLAVAVVIGHLASLAVKFPILWRHRESYAFRVDFGHPRMKELWRLSLPVFVSTGGFQIDRITDRFFASLLTAGSLSALAFASLLVHFPEKLLFNPFQTATFPHFTRLIATEKYDALSKQLFQYVRLLFFLAVPAAVGMIVLGDLIVSAVYQRGAFDERAVDLTTLALALYAAGLPAALMGHALNKTFVGLKDTRTVMRLNLFRIGTKIVLALVLIPFLAHGGIALAESVSHYARTALLFHWLPAEVKGDEAWETARSFAGTLGATAIMGVGVYALRHASDGHLHVILQVACLAPIGAAIFLVASWLSRQSEVQWLGRSLAAMTRRG